jgi:hypothetical protein
MDAKSLITGVSLGVAGFVVLGEVKKVLSKPKASRVKNASPGDRNYLIGGNWKVRRTLVGIFRNKSICGSLPPTKSTPSQSTHLSLILQCNLTLDGVTALVKSLNSAGPIPDNVDVVVGVPMPYLSLVRSTLRSDIEVAAQDSCVKTFGANTGEVSLRCWLP